MRKTTFILILLIIHTVLYPIILTSQILNHSNDYEIIKESKQGINIQSSNKQAIYLPNDRTPLEKWDTLYISFDLASPEIRVVGPTYVYQESDFTWVSSTLKYILLNNEHQFQIGLSWEILPYRYIVFEEDYSINNTDTLEFSSLDAIYEVVVNPVDHNGTPFNLTYSYKCTCIYVMIPMGLGYYTWQSLQFYNGITYFSELSENYSIQCSSVIYDVDVDNFVCFIEHPTINGINQNYLLENQPEDYISSNLQMHITSEDVEHMSIGFLSGIRYLSYTGTYHATSSGFLKYIDNIEFWNGEIFLINQENDAFKNTLSLMTMTTNHNQLFTECETPNLEIINDSIGAFYGMLPPLNVFKAGNTDTLFFGETPTTFWQTWLNNTSNGDIRTYSGSYGIMYERIRPIEDSVSHIVKDSEGSIIFEGSGSNVIFNAPEQSNYTVEITCLASPLNSGYGISKVISSFNFGTHDASPPIIDPIQLRDVLNKPTHRIKSGEQLTLLFSAADYNDYTDSLTNLIFFSYQSVINDSTEVYIKESNSEDWIDIVVEKYYEDSINGYYYRADLSEYTYLDSTSLDLKIKICDYNDNSAIYIISPAILIDDFVITDIETNYPMTDNLDINIYPNPAINTLTIQNNGNTQIESIKIMDLSGKVVKYYNLSKVQIDISDLDQGVYFVKLNAGGSELIKKVVVID